jgi:hypothetical protein
VVYFVHFLVFFGVLCAFALVASVRYLLLRQRRAASTVDFDPERTLVWQAPRASSAAVR